MFELRREMDRLFDDYWVIPTAARAERSRQPACDVEESEDHYLITLEMPGIPRDQINIECVGNQISISGERKREHDHGKAYSERYYGNFHRRFTLPDGVNSGKIDANYQDGILRIYVPKAESAKPRQIKITNGSDKGFFGKLLGNSPKEKEGVHSSDENKIA